MTLILWAAILFAVFVNTVLCRFLPKIEGLILILHVMAFFAILIPLLYMAPHNSAQTVFTTFLNEGAWPTTGTSFMVGLLVPANVLIGKAISSTFYFFFFSPPRNADHYLGSDAAVHV